jgi:hypothetical protein
VCGWLVESWGGAGVLSEPELLTVTGSVQDRGPAFGGERFVAELEDFSVVRGSGGSAWEAIRALICSHRALLERRWSEGAKLHDDALSRDRDGACAGETIRRHGL